MSLWHHVGMEFAANAPHIALGVRVAHPEKDSKMLDDSIPAKTAAGRMEVEQRLLRLGARQRTVLVSINGERTLDTVRRQFESFGDVGALIGELASAGLIEFNNASPAVTSQKEALADIQRVAAPVADAGSSHLQLARTFMNDTVVSVLGLRAFVFKLKIEKCATQRDLFDLLPEFRRQLRKVVTNAEVNAYHDQAEALLTNV